MNYLAHIYLSGTNEAVKIGNFMADSIKGKTYLEYPEIFQKGILLHREIDSFTDGHPTVYKSAHRLFEDYGHYNTVITDVLYDHFLAKNWALYHPQKLRDYVTNFYKLLEENFEVLPNNVQNFYPYMVAQNWLLSYAEIEGIQNILKQMNGRVKTNVQLQHAVKELKLYYPEFEAEFTSFFAELESFVAKKKKELGI